MLSRVGCKMILQQAVSMLEDVRSCHGRRVFMAQMQVQDDACNAEPTCQQLFSMPKGNSARSTIAKLKAGNTMIKKFARYFAAEPTFEESVSIPEARLHRRTISKRVTSQEMKKKLLNLCSSPECKAHASRLLLQKWTLK